MVKVDFILLTFPIFLMKKNKKDGLTLKRLIKIAEHDYNNRDLAVVYINGKFYEDYTHMQCITQFLKENDITILQTDFIHRPQNDQFLELSKEYGPIVLGHIVNAENAIYIIVGYNNGEMFGFDSLDQSIIDEFKNKYNCKILDEMSHVNDPEIDNMYDEEENSEKMYQREKELQEDNKDNLLNFMKEHGFSVPTGEYGEGDIFVKDQYMVSQYDINYLYLNEFGKPAKKIKAKDLDAETPKKSNPLYEYLLSINAKLDRGLNDCTVSFKNKYGQDVEIYLYHEDLDISDIDNKDYKKFKHVIPQELDATKENVEKIYNTKFELKK